MMVFQQYQPEDRRLILTDAQRCGFAYHMEELSNLFYLTIMEAEQPAKAKIFMGEAQIHLTALAELLVDKNFPTM